ncbi:hypothetical protein HWV62_43022 [Athelia sp. TMB]|nr:hypothetical protein HWV62_43022 [Athelia sp. TMB]
MMATDRKLSYKVPTTIITDRLVSQEARRNKALEDQKRRRAQRVDSSRQLDLFADLHLGPSDDDEPEIVREGVASFASMVGPSNLPPDITPVRGLLEPKEIGKSKKKGKKKKRVKTDGAKPSKWADNCMYAELLEMRGDDTWNETGRGDGLPEDLETGWVAVAPVPVGKRCLAVTHQSSGVVGVVPNTSLRSRVLGKPLMVPFPSNLPPQTILDCILDPDWRDNGIVHVLDVLQWKGQDVADCETPFRFWWRDTRLAELPRSLPPSNPTVSSSKITSDLPNTSSGYQFPYPTTFLAIPYFTNTSLPFLSSHVIPLARSLRSVSVDVPLPVVPTAPAEPTMDVDGSLPPLQALTSLSVILQSDGLLLYVAQASYEPGTSPLSSWIPITGYGSGASGGERPLDLFDRSMDAQLV